MIEGDQAGVVAVDQTVEQRQAGLTQGGELLLGDAGAQIEGEHDAERHIGLADQRHRLQHALIADLEVGGVQSRRDGRCC